MAENVVTVIGAGMAGSEAAWQAAERGATVRLIEMRPHKMTPAHQTGYAAEIVCSNSFKSNLLTNASGVLKEEMRRLGSLIVSCADDTAVPAGEALAVDREVFSERVTERLQAHPNITLVREEAVDFPADGPVVIASGPLTSDALAARIGELTGRYDLYFYDAVAPIVDASTIDYTKVFRASRYGKSGEADGSGEDDAAYLNCPFEKDEYLAFHAELMTAEKAPMHDFEDVKYFESCLPVEELAARGPKTLTFGPLKPVGLEDPRTGRRPYAVVQLRQENKAATLYNLVGFQTRLKWGEQKRILRMIPGLENAEFVRYGVMHRNTYIHSPSLLSPTLQMREHPRIFFAGQIVGVEGYLESAAMGLIAGINAARLAKDEPPLAFPAESILGSLTEYVSAYEGKNFAPMNSCWGLLPPLEGARVRDKRERGAKMGERALAAFDNFTQKAGLRASAALCGIAAIAAVLTCAAARPAEAITLGFAQPATIHCWAERGDLSHVAEMLSHNPALREQRQGYLGTPLAVAAENGKVSVVAYLIRKGANVNARCPDDFDSQAVLMAACRGLGVPDANRMAIVRMLVEHNALVRVVDRSGYTALHTAAYWGHADVVAYLLLNGADLMALDEDGRTPFTEAIRGASMWDDWRLVRFIRMAVAQGADVNARTASGDTMLHLAAKAGKVHTVDFLLAQKADVNALDHEGRTPLTAALERGQTAAADLLKQNGGTAAPPPVVTVLAPTAIPLPSAPATTTVADTPPALQSSAQLVPAAETPATTPPSAPAAADAPATTPPSAPAAADAPAATPPAAPVVPAAATDPKP